MQIYAYAGGPCGIKQYLLGQTPLQFRLITRKWQKWRPNNGRCMCSFKKVHGWQGRWDEYFLTQKKRESICIEQYFPLDLHTSSHLIKSVWLIFSSAEVQITDETWAIPTLLDRQPRAFYSYEWGIVTFKWYLIIHDKSLPHKQRRSFTRLLIFKIKFSSEPPTRWLTGSAEMTPVIGSARLVRGEVTLTIQHPHKLINECGPPAARELRLNHKKSCSFNLRLNLKIANFLVRLHGTNQRPNHR